MPRRARPRYKRREEPGGPPSPAPPAEDFLPADRYQENWRAGGPGMLSMRGLECLVSIVERGSLTKAAAVLHMSQPALSHQIAAIERELGTPVIERLPRGVRPTAAGLAAAAEARVALAAADRAVTAARRVAAGAGGRIRIASAETMTAWVLVPVLRSWRRRFPQVELDLKEYTSADRMEKALHDGGT